MSRATEAHLRLRHRVVWLLSATAVGVILHLNGFTRKHLAPTESFRGAVECAGRWRKGPERRVSRPDFRFELYIHSDSLLNTWITGL
eukprot:1734959-Prymnesium_polylepis.2